MALAVAAEQQSTEAMKLLLQRGAEINARAGPYGNAVQAVVVDVGVVDSEALKLLLMNGARIDSPGVEWDDLLRYKCYTSERKARLRALQNICGEASRRSERMTSLEADELVERFLDVVRKKKPDWM